MLLVFALFLLMTAGGTSCISTIGVALLLMTCP